MDRSGRSTSPRPPGEKPKPKGLLKEKLELEKIKSKDNGKPRYTIRRIEDTLSFDKGFYVFIRALQLLKSHNDGCIIVGIAGPSGSGKTAFTEQVRNFMPGVAVISMDNYNDASKLIDDNFDDPRLTDYELLLANIADLRQGKPVQMPIYDFKQSKRVGYTAVEVPESRVVIVEGIYALSERLRAVQDLRVSVSGGVHFDLVKRVLRDVHRSGQGPEEIIQQITDTVYPMYKAFIEPDLATAQIRIYNHFNPFTGFMNATYILKSAKETGIAAALSALGPGTKQTEEAEMYDIYLLPPNEDPETCQTWLRMRNKEGRYSLMFEEWVSDGPFTISPRITFEVSVRILGGLMALGYTIGTIMKRTSTVLTAAHSDKDGSEVTVKFDDIEQLGRFVQIQGKDRSRVAELGSLLGLDGTYIPRSYIEQVQLGKLTANFQSLTDDVKRHFTVNGESIIDEYGSWGSPAADSRLMSQSLPSHSSSAPIAIGPSAMQRRIGSFNSTPKRGGLSQQLRGNGTGSNGAAGDDVILASPGMQPPTSPPIGRTRSGSVQGGDGSGNVTFGGSTYAPAGPSGGGSSANGAGSAGSGGAAAALEELKRGMSSGGGGAASAAAIAKMGDRLDIITEHVHRYSGLQLQMDAMICQYRQVNEALAKASGAIAKLQTAVETVAAPPPPAAAVLPAPRPDWVTLAAVGGACLAAGGLLGLLLTRPR